MADDQQVVDTSALESELLRLPSIKVARIALSSEGRLGHVTVIAECEARSEAQIKRDVRSLLFVRAAVSVPMSAISVILAGEGWDHGSKRIRLVWLRYRTAVDSEAVEVGLSLGEQEATGTAPVGKGGSLVLRAVAEATFNAVAVLMRRCCCFEVLEVRRLSLGCSEVALVGVRARPYKGNDTLVGASYINSDEREAVARAALDAINRRFRI